MLKYTTFNPCRYSVNGEGIPYFETIAEGNRNMHVTFLDGDHTHKALEMLAQCQMLWMLLSMSVGWTLGSTTAHPIKDRGQLATILTVAGLHIFLVLWEQSFDESHYTYHVHESLPGLLLVVLRGALVVLFGYNLKQTISRERSVLRKDFFQSFAIVSVSTCHCMSAHDHCTCHCM